MAEKRGKNNNYIILRILRIIFIFCIIIFVFCSINTIFYIGELLLQSKGFYRALSYLAGSYILIILFADITVLFATALWTLWIKYDQCDILADEQYNLSLLKKNKKNVILHKNLLHDSLLLGKYDECRQEIEELHQLESRLKPLQRIEIQLYYIDYLMAVNITEPLHTELENAENLLASISVKRDQMKQAYQRGIRFRRYRIEERWEDMLEFLRTDCKRRQNALEQVNNAYYCGWCCYCLGRYEEAFYELKFAAEYGGNSKYVKLANELIEQIPEKKIYENKIAGQSKKLKYSLYKRTAIILTVCGLLVCGLLTIISIGVNGYFTHGDSIEEVYSKKYFCAQDELVLIYQKEIDNYEMAILYDGKDVAYCLFEETDKYYKLIKSYRVSLDYLRRSNFPEVKEGEEDFFTGSDIGNVITGFYKKHDIFYREDAEYVGICFYPLGENIKIDDELVNIQQLDRVIYIDDVPVYLWSLDNVDINTISFRTFIFAYRAEE